MQQRERHWQDIMRRGKLLVLVLLVVLVVLLLVLLVVDLGVVDHLDLGGEKIREALRGLLVMG